MHAPFRTLALTTAVLLAACGGGGGSDDPPAPVPPEPPAPPKLDYPATPAQSVTDTYFGHVISDPYRWLEDIKGENTDAWVQAQNQFSAKYITAMKDFPALSARLDELFVTQTDATSAGLRRTQSTDTGKQEQAQQIEGVQDASGRFYFQYKTSTDTRNHSTRPAATRHAASADNRIYVADSASTTAQARVLVDADQYRIDPDDDITLTNHQVTADGKYLVYAMTRNYSDLSELHVISLQDAPLGLIQRIPYVAFGGFVLHDGTLFFSRPQSTQDEHVSPHTFQSLYQSAIGGTPELLYAAPQYDGVGPMEVADGFLYTYHATGTNIALGRIDLSAPEGGVRMLLDGRAQNHTFNKLGADPDDSTRTLVATTHGADYYRLLSIDLDRPDPADWREILPNSPPGVTEYINTIVACGDGYYAERLTEGNAQVVYYPGASSSTQKLVFPQDGLGAISNMYCGQGEQGNILFRYQFSSLSEPSQFYEYDPQTRDLSTAGKTTYAGYDPDDYTMRQIMVPGKDGVLIPVYLAHRKDLDTDGGAPTLIYVYGGFQVPIMPEFSAKNIPLMESGGIYAIAQVRGGSEQGNAWSEAGRLLNKQTTYDDVIAVASHLIDLGLTTPAKLGLQGESNGGLTTAAVALQRPDLFGVVMPTVGVLDQLRYDLFSSGFSWLPDYGSNQVQAEFENKLAFSPLHQVKNQSYPPTYVFGAKSDGRVMPAHSYKFAATMQNAAGGTNPYLLYAFPKDGHSLMRHDNQFLTYMWTVFFHHTGLSYKAPAP